MIITHKIVVIVCYLPRSADLPNVFGLAQSHHRFFPDTFKQFKAQGVRRVSCSIPSSKSVYFLFSPEHEEQAVPRKLWNPAHPSEQRRRTKNISFPALCFAWHQVAIVYREDVTELVSAGAAAIKAAGDELLPVQNNIGYAVNANASSAEAVKGVAKQLNTSSAEALVACVLTEDAHQFIDAIHEMKKPLKSMVFTNGPASE
eukprot:1155852-Pelagomonas_calceolata.AAC.1